MGTGDAINNNSISILEIINVSLTYSTGKNTSKQVLEDVTIAVNPGSWITIMGESGSGKTSLLNIAAGLLKPTSGQVYLDGVDITQLSNKDLTHLRRTKIGIIHQDYLLFPELTVYENISLPLKLDGKTLSTDECESLLDRLGISGYIDAPISNLSGGQKQRVAIARALSYSPAVLFADEPTAALDSDTAKGITTLLRQLADDGLTIVLVTHSPVVAASADAIFFMKNGVLADKTDAISGKELATLWYDISSS